jgi:hypothetical protein
MAHRVNGHIAVVRVDLDDYVLAFSGRVTLVSGREGSFDGRYDHRVWQIALGGKLRYRQQKLTFHFTGPLTSIKPVQAALEKIQ